MREGYIATCRNLLPNGNKMKGRDLLRDPEVMEGTPDSLYHQGSDVREEAAAKTRNVHARGRVMSADATWPRPVHGLALNCPRQCPRTVRAQAAQCPRSSHTMSALSPRQCPRSGRAMSALWPHQCPRFDRAMSTPPTRPGHPTSPTDSGSSLKQQITPARAQSRGAVRVNRFV